MARQTGRDLVEVTALGLLLQQPRHPYDLHRFILDTHKDFITGLPRSLYHAIDRLVGAGLIESLETIQDGHRPERTVYGITEEGKAELATRLRRMLESPHTDSQVLSAALSLMGCLPSEEVERSLQTRAATLEGIVVTAERTLADLQSHDGLPRLLLLEVEYERAVRAAELEWVRGLLAEIRAGEISWHGLLEPRWGMGARPAESS